MDTISHQSPPLPDTCFIPGKMSENEILGMTPLPGVEYPLNVTYCGNCTMPIEYCEYYPGYDECKQWLEKNMPDMFQELKGEAGGVAEEGGCKEKKRKKRGGKGMVKAKKKAEESPRKVEVFATPRTKKRNTVITGLKTFGDDEIVVQGDIEDDLLNLIPKKWAKIGEDSIKDGGEHKR